MASYAVVSSHRTMVFDDTRNEAYRQALRNVVSPESVVLDLGAGVGVLGLEAARLGAKHVYFVDPAPVVHVAAEVAKHNGLADRVTVIQAAIEDAVLPEKVDVITSVFTGNFLLGEDLLPLLFLARDRHLKPGGRLLPDRARMHVVPVEADAWFDAFVGCWSVPQAGLRYDPGRRFAANHTYPFDREGTGAAPLSEPATLAEIDLRVASRAECRSSVEVEVRRDGTIHALLGWFDLRLDTSWLSTGPDAPPTHWRPILLPIEPPLQVRAGTKAEIAVLRPEHGDWTWSLRCGKERRRHSTFLVTPRTTTSVRRLADDAQPALTARGGAARRTLEAMDGSRSIEAIAAELREQHPESFPTQEAAGRFVRKLVERYAT